MATVLEAAQTSIDPQPRPAPHEPQSAFYHPELDGLRFLAFLAVFAHHALDIGQPRTSARVRWLVDSYHALVHAGEFGVELFFVLSAYLITRLLLREQAQRGRIDVRAFYVRRLLRIWPLYFAYLAYAFFLEPHLLPPLNLPVTYAVPMAAFVGNLPFALWRDVPNSTTISLWTVSVEEQFYLLWPLLLVALGVRRMRVLAGLLLIVSFAARWQLASNSLFYYHTLCRMDGFVFGTLLALTPSQPWMQWSDGTRKLAWWTGLISIVVVSGFMREATLAPEWAAQRYLLGSAASALLVTSVLRPFGTAPSGLAGPTPVFLGRISYGLYVYHRLGLIIVGRALSTVLHGPLLLLSVFGGAFLVTLTLATASYFGFEKFFLRWKLRYTHVTSRPGG